MVKKINDGDFNKEVINSDKPVVVDFWASWCGPCKMLGPVIEEVESQLGKEVKFAKLNIDENPVMANTYRISSIPTLLIFKNGKPAGTLVGFKPKAEIISAIQKYI